MSAATDREAVRRRPARVAPAAFDGRDRFAAYVAHELRAPLALQRALVEVTLADPRADAAALREMGERVLASCVQQQRLIDALLVLARNARRLTRREPVDLAAVAAEVLRAQDPCGVGCVVALEPAWTAGDAELLERLAANLVSNAIRHNVAGGWIEVATCAEAGRAVLSVANSGASVPAAGIPDGVGLGLSIVQAIADAHGAALTARALAGGGLGIDVAFPALD
jgi:signal transduction histidine kinase